MVVCLSVCLADEKTLMQANNKPMIANERMKTNMNEPHLTRFTRLRNTIGDVHKKCRNQHKRCSNLRKGNTVPKITHFSNLLSNHTVNNKNIIPSIIDQSNTKKSHVVLGNEIPGPTKGTASHAADILIERPENALSQGLAKNLSIENTVLSNSTSVKCWNI